MYLGLSLALLLGGGIVGARLLGLRSLWDRILAAAIIALAELVVLTLGIGLFPGGYRPLPLTLGAGVLLLLLVAVGLVTGRIAAPPLEPEDRSYLSAFLWVIILTLPVWLWILFSGLILPAVYWDELYYHLVAPAVWARAGQIHFFAMGNPFVTGYPVNLELPWGWAMVMTGNDVWADLGGLPFVFIGLAAVFTLCKRLGVAAGHTFWAGLLFVTTPMVIFHAKSSYIDLPMSVLFAIAAYFLHRYAREGDRIQLLLGGVTMGLMVGAKYSGPYMAIAGLLPILYYFRTAPIRKQTWAQAFFLYGLPIILLGGFWYGRNLILFQNPLHPMRLTVAGVTIFDGQYDPDAFTFTKPENGWVTLAKAIIDLEKYPHMDSYYTGFGPQLLLLAMPATALFLVKERRQRKLMLITWLLPLLISVAVLPARFPRYLMHLNLFLLPFAAWLLQDMGRWPARLVKAVAVSFAVYCALIAMPIYFVWPVNYHVGAETVWAAHRIGPGWQAEVLQELRQELGRPLRILAGTVRLNYPLLGERWENELLYVEPTDEATWLEGVRNSGADLLWSDGVVEEGVEAVWAEKHPELFTLHYTDGYIHVYRILREGEAGR